MSDHFEQTRRAREEEKQRKEAERGICRSGGCVPHFVDHGRDALNLSVHQRPMVQNRE